MAKKKKKTKTEKREIRLRKARQWITTYNGSPKNITKSYRKRFHLDITTAIKDLQAIGVKFTQDYLDAVKKNEEERIKQKHLLKEEKKLQDADFYGDLSDDNFAFIAGYTSGGAPYGTTWKELGIEPYAPYEELVEAYEQRMILNLLESDDQYEDLDFLEQDEDLDLLDMEYDEDDDFD